ncbi:MAG: hypothetical protein KAR42_03015 [candidate division Zixibacteria bacterium]|nr:hypothetical protein [candidate division Zixibacteria bacterium]
MTNTNEQSKIKDELANKIAKSLQEEHRTELYRHMFQKQDESIIRRAFDEVSKVPVSKIKKSKSALFFFLLNKYAEK